MVRKLFLPPLGSSLLHTSSLPEQLNLPASTSSYSFHLPASTCTDHRHLRHPLPALPPPPPPPSPPPLQPPPPPSYPAPCGALAQDLITLLRWNSELQEHALPAWIVLYYCLFKCTCVFLTAISASNRSSFRCFCGSLVVVVLLTRYKSSSTKWGGWGLLR